MIPRLTNVPWRSHWSCPLEISTSSRFGIVSVHDSGWQLSEKCDRSMSCCQPERAHSRNTTLSMTQPNIDSTIKIKPHKLACKRAQKGFTCFWRRQASGWAAVVMKVSSLLSSSLMLVSNSLKHNWEPLTASCTFPSSKQKPILSENRTVSKIFSLLNQLCSFVSILAQQIQDCSVNVQILCWEKWCFFLPTVELCDSIKEKSLLGCCPLSWKCVITMLA